MLTWIIIFAIVFAATAGVRYLNRNWKDKPAPPSPWSER